MQKFLQGILALLVGATALALLAAISPGLVGQPFDFQNYYLPLMVGSILGLVFFQWSLKSRLDKDRLSHVNQVLRAIRNVNHMLTRAKDRDSLVQGICDTLIDTRSYFSIWVALLSEDGEWDSFTEAGLGDNFQPIIERLKRGEMMACCRKVLSQPDVIITDSPTTLCGDCPLVIGYNGHGAISARLEYNGKIYGLLTLSVNKEFIFDDEEQQLIKEVATDIAFGLYGLEIKKSHRDTQQELQISVHELGERIKELDCLFGLSNLVEQPRLSLEDILVGTVDLIPPAWQFPDITCAQIIMEGNIYKTGNFKETSWKLEKDIIVFGRPVGSLMVCYTEEKLLRDAGPFSNEEKNLLRAVAERLGRIVERRQAQAELRESERRFRALVENSLTGISIIQDNRVVYQNCEQERLFGPLPRSYILADFHNIHPDDLNKVKQISHDISSGNIQALDVTFRYSPSGDMANLIWIHCRAHIIKYQQKKSILVNMMDMTKIKELEDLLLSQDKMASLGRVAAGIAHEIRNPLSGINIYLNTLEKFFNRGESEERVNDVFRHLQSASRKIESVIRRVMDFSKPSEPKFIAADINQPVEEAIKLTAVTLRKSGIKLDKALTEDLPKCRLDLQQIEEVVLNLINNAVDAMKSMADDKKIKVTSSVDHDNITVRVIDSGPGVTIGNKDKVFDPFFTTKSDSTGIGLSICHRIITDHAGTLSVQSSEWGGAEFRISIPVMDT